MVCAIGVESLVTLITYTLNVAHEWLLLTKGKNNNNHLNNQIGNVVKVVKVEVAQIAPLSTSTYF